nr:signal peptidase I [Corynebacterium lowii]
MPWYLEIPLIIGITLLIVFVVQTFIGRVYMIPSGSMEPTLHGCTGCAGDRIAVEKVSYYFSDPKPGDVVVFAGTPSWNGNFVSQRSENPVIHGLQDLGSYVGLVAPDENNLVKRIIATGGQTVSCQAGDPAVMVDGKPTDQSFILNPPQDPVGESEYGSDACGGEYFGPITVPEGNVWVMGDNRTGSADSRAHMGDEYQGTVPVENIRGKTVARIWPLDRIGLVDSPDIQDAEDTGAAA